MFNKKGLNLDGFLYLTLNDFEKTKILDLIQKNYVPVYQCRSKNNLLLGFVVNKLCLPINGRKSDYNYNLNRFMNNENIFICAFDHFNCKYYSATVSFKQFFIYLDVNDMCMDTVIMLTKENKGIIEEYTKNDATFNTFQEISAVDTLKNKLERTLSKEDMAKINQLEIIQKGLGLGGGFLILILLILFMNGVIPPGLYWLSLIFIIISFICALSVLCKKGDDIFSKYTW